MTTTGNVGIEETLWNAADKLRGRMDSGEYKYVVLGLLFLKYISDKFEEKYHEIIEEGDAFEEDRNEYDLEKVFWVPVESRWGFIKDRAYNSNIGRYIDDAMIMIENENPALLGVFDKRYARIELDKCRLGELFDLVSKIKLYGNDGENLLGQVYEYFLGKFASTEGKGGGEFYTPKSVVKTLVEMIEPFQGRIYDPACGSGGIFIQSKNFLEENQGRIENLSIYGQELNPATWKLCRMNLVIHGLDGNIGHHHADTFHNDLHHTLKADYILANPPFNISNWGGEELINDVRWQYGTPPEGNANYAWLQHMVHHLAANGVAGIVLANGSLSSNISTEGEIRKNLINTDLVECIVALPDKLFHSTGIPVCLWILNQNKKKHDAFRSREQEILFIDARSLGTMVDRRLRELSDEHINQISETYHNWRKKDGEYKDVLGFCKTVNIKEIKEEHGYVLVPGRYVGVKEENDDGVSYKEKMGILTREIGELFSESKRLENEIKTKMLEIGFEI